jgi:putative nucleotidyltransferase with HDIG domain
VNPTVLFLAALGQAFSALALYGPEHPTRQAATDRVHRALINLLTAGTPLRLSFMDDEVVAGARPITGLRGWEWGSRLSAAGIQRLEVGLSPAVTPADIELMLDAIRSRLLAPTEAPVVWAQGPIRLGPLGVDGGGGGGGGSRGGPAVVITPVADPLASSGLASEIEGVSFVHDEVSAGRQLPMVEVDGIVRALAVTVQREQGLLLPLLDIRNADEYTTAHCCNVAMLSMGLSVELGLSDDDTRAIGAAALLHDIGKVRIPREVLTKPGALTVEERALIETHPVEGAKILSGRGIGHSLAATVAYEHHIWFNGEGGYPRFTFPRDTHFASRIVHVADIYDALCSRRPYRDAWPRDRALTLIASLAGVELDPHIAGAFIRMANHATEVRSQVSEQLG